MTDFILLARRSRHLHRSLFVAALLIAVSAIGLDAATVEGRVLDPLSETYVNGALVRVVGTEIRAVTDRGGRYTLTNVPEGRQEIEVRYLGFPSKRQTVEISPGAQTLDFALDVAVDELETFVVEGRVVAQAQALNLQRNSRVTASVVSADAIGQFPDQNAAEALSRLPGVSIERDQGEGRFVVIRGIDPNLNAVAIDGVRLASPSAGERATLLDTIPSDTIQRLEVYKAVLPNMPGDTVGGYINIKTPSAYDFDSRVARISMQGNYSELIDSWDGKIAASWGDVFNNSKVGLMLNVSYEERSFGSDNNEADPWEIESGTDGTEGYVSGEVQYREYDLVRKRTGVSANLEFKPEHDRYFYIRASYNNYQDVEFRHSAIFEPDDFAGISGNSFTGIDTEHVREIKDREENMNIQALSVGGENTWDAWTLDYRLSYSYAKEDTPYDSEMIYEFGDVVDVRFTGTDSYLLGLSQVGGPALTDPANYEFDEITDAFQLVEETDWSLELNARYAFDQQALRSIQFGFLGRKKEKQSNPEEFASDDNPGAVENFGDFSSFLNRDPLRTGLPYVTRDFRNYFLANRAAFAMERDEVDSRIEDFTSNEDVYAFYLMADFFLEGWEVVLGARLEETRFDTRGIEYNDDTGVFTATSSSNDYSNFLPGLHVKREIGEAMVFRFSANRSIARPNFEQTIPGAEVEGDEVTVGNPLLKPLEATNFDVSYEYYLPPLGVFSAALFYKDIENFIYEQTLIQDYRGIAGAEVTTFRNGPSGSIKGLELGYQQQFSGALAGFGLIANLTLTDGEATVLPAEDGDPLRELPFIKQAETVANLALTYENHGFFFRVAASYRDDFLDEVGENELEDRYIDSFIQWDVSSSYDINDQVTVFANFVNIDNEPFRAYFGRSGRLSQWESYSWSANVGVRWTF